MPQISTGIISGILISGALLVAGNMSGGAGYISPNLSSNTLQDFKKSSGEPCGEKYFDIQPKKLNQLPEADPSSPPKKFIISSNTLHKRDSSCLVVNWQKTAYQEGKGQGSFKWNGSFINSDSGLLSFNIINLNDNTNNTFSGIIYLLSKEQDKGFIGQKKEISTQLSTDLKNYVPNIKTLTEKIKVRDLKTFTTNDEEFEQLCDPKKCISPSKKEYFKASGLWRKINKDSNLNNAISPYDGSSNFKEWGHRTYYLADGNLTHQIYPFVGMGRNIDIKFQATSFKN